MEKKKLLIIEQFNSFFRLIHLNLLEKQNLEVTSLKKVKNYNQLTEEGINFDKIILSLSPENCTTITKTMHLRRENKEEKIDEGEMGKLIYKALWKFLDENRGWASEKMNVKDSEMVLGNINIVNASLDNHTIFNPLGFKGEKLTLTLRGSFISRNSLDFFDIFSNKKNKVEIIEGLSFSSSLTQNHSGVFHLRRDSSYSFWSKEREVTFREFHPIGINDLIDSIANPLSVSRENAALIIDRYLSGNLSKRFRDFISDRTADFYAQIESFLKKFSKDLEGKVFLNMPKNLFDFTISKNSNFEYIDYINLLEKRGFNVILKEDKQEKEPEIFEDKSFTALLVKPIFNSHYTYMNKVLESKSKWLIPNK
ncbi:MAG: hypothetical protein ABEI53_00170 [Candidatus Magasanikbacteria bacterium]